MLSEQNTEVLARLRREDELLGELEFSVQQAVQPLSRPAAVLVVTVCAGGVVALTMAFNEMVELAGLAKGDSRLDILTMIVLMSFAGLWALAVFFVLVHRSSSDEPGR